MLNLVFLYSGDGAKKSERSNFDHIYMCMNSDNEIYRVFASLLVDGIYIVTNRETHIDILAWW